MSVTPPRTPLSPTTGNLYGDAVNSERQPFAYDKEGYGIFCEPTSLLRGYGVGGVGGVGGSGDVGAADADAVDETAEYARLCVVYLNAACEDRYNETMIDCVCNQNDGLKEELNKANSRLTDAKNNLAATELEYNKFNDLKEHAEPLTRLTAVVQDNLKNMRAEIDNLEIDVDRLNKEVKDNTHLRDQLKGKRASLHNDARTADENIDASFKRRMEDTRASARTDFQTKKARTDAA